jgi:hypothetical protein
MFSQYLVVCSIVALDADQNLFFYASHPAGNPQRKVDLFLIAWQASRSLRSKYTVSAETVLGVKLQAILIDVDQTAAIFHTSFRED